jgi:hypothetical protein
MSGKYVRSRYLNRRIVRDPGRQRWSRWVRSESSPGTSLVPMKSKRTDAIRIPAENPVSKQKFVVPPSGGKNGADTNWHRNGQDPEIPQHPPEGGTTNVVLRMCGHDLLDFRQLLFRVDAHRFCDVEFRGGQHRSALALQNLRTIGEVILTLAIERSDFLE